MIVITTLKDGFSDFSVYKSFQCSNHMWNRFICAGILVKRINRSFLINHQDQVQVIWHDHIFVYEYARDPRSRQYIFFQSFSDPAELYQRGV